MSQKSHTRGTFSGKLGFVLSAAGASVGLGNIWRFPYLAAKYGGGIFLLVYILLAMTFGYTMIVAETSLGRMTGKSPVGAFAAFGKSGWLRFGGWINAIIPILIVPYYSVIGGWVVKYLADYVLGRSSGKLLKGNIAVFNRRQSQTATGVIPPPANFALRLRDVLADITDCSISLAVKFDSRGKAEFPRYRRVHA